MNQLRSRSIPGSSATLVESKALLFSGRCPTVVMNPNANNGFFIKLSNRCFPTLGKEFEDGTELPYNTLLDWASKSVDHLQILHEVQKKYILSTKYMHADETGLKVLCPTDTKKYRKIHDGTLWCYNNSVERMVFFEYQRGRGEKYADGILKEFCDHLQTDGWQVYKSIAERYKCIILLYCMAHARRKFIELIISDILNKKIRQSAS